MRFSPSVPTPPSLSLSPVLTSPCPLQVLLQELNTRKVQTSRNGVYFPLSCACDALGPWPRAVLSSGYALPQGATLEGLRAPEVPDWGSHQASGCPWVQPGTAGYCSSPPGTETEGFLQFWTWLRGEREVTVQSGLEWCNPAHGAQTLPWGTDPIATSQPPKLLLCHLPSSWTHCALSLPQAAFPFPPPQADPDPG